MKFIVSELRKMRLFNQLMQTPGGQSAGGLRQKLLSQSEDNAAKRLQDQIFVLKRERDEQKKALRRSKRARWAIGMQVADEMLKANLALIRSEERLRREVERLAAVQSANVVCVVHGQAVDLKAA